MQQSPRCPDFKSNMIWIPHRETMKQSVIRLPPASDFVMQPLSLKVSKPVWDYLDAIIRIIFPQNFRETKSLHECFHPWKTPLIAYIL